MQLIEVNNGATAEDFICVNVELNRQYASYIRPLDSDVRAVFDRRKNKGDSFPVGGIGFFRRINNQDAADLLFDVSRHWLLQRGMRAMAG